jgi:hypothetical protein
MGSLVRGVTARVRRTACQGYKLVYGGYARDGVSGSLHEFILVGSYRESGRYNTQAEENQRSFDILIGKANFD